MTLLLIVFLLRTMAHPQGDGIPPTFAAIVVSDMDSSVAWYGRALKLRVRDRMDRPDRGFRVANLTNLRLWLELIRQDVTVPRDQVLAGFAQGSRLMGWTKVGCTVRDPASGVATALCADPDGNVLQIFGQ